MEKDYHKQLSAYKRRRAKIEKLLKNGLSYQDIGKIMGASRQRIMAIAHELGHYRYKSTP